MVRNRVLSFEALPLVLGLALAPVLSARAQKADPVVTSDTPEYCGVLKNRISLMSRASTLPTSLEAAALSEEGERMCTQGQTRGGIMRLRRALAIMRRGEE